LDNSTEHHHAGTREDGPSATKPIVDEGNEWKSADGTKVVNGGNNALQGSSGMVEI